MGIFPSEKSTQMVLSKSQHMSTSSSGILPSLPLKWCQKVNNDYSGSEHIATIISAKPEASLDWQPPASPATTMRPQSRAAQRSRKSLGSSKRSYRSGLIPRMRYSDFFLAMASMANLFWCFNKLSVGVPPSSTPKKWVKMGRHGHFGRGVALDLGRAIVGCPGVRGRKGSHVRLLPCCLEVRRKEPLTHLADLASIRSIILIF